MPLGTLWCDDDSRGVVSKDALGSPILVCYLGVSSGGEGHCSGHGGREGDSSRGKRECMKEGTEGWSVSELELYMLAQCAPPTYISGVRLPGCQVSVVFQATRSHE